MASVAPISCPLSTLRNAAAPVPSERSWRVQVFIKLLHRWQQMQVSYYGGKYSIHRVLALDEYTKKTSFRRVLLVFIATPLPMIALVYGQELIPLQELSDGWSANYGMWIRTAVLVCIVTHALIVQATYLIDDFVLSTSQVLLLYICMPACVVAFAMLVAAYLVFPIPFFVLFVAPPFFLLLVASIRIVVGARAMSRMLAHGDQVTRCVRFVCAQTSMVFLFPIYESLFHAAEGTSYQVPVILLLPVLKVALKNVVLHYAKSLEDMIPVEVIFTADFFNAVYVATCMHSASSTATVAAIVVTDLSQTIIMLCGMQRRTSCILTRLYETVESTTKNDNMLTMICTLCRNPASFKKLSHVGIRRRSCLPHPISTMSKHVLGSLDEILADVSAESKKSQNSAKFSTGPRYPSIPNQDILPTRCCFSSICSRKETKVIHPINPNGIKRGLRKHRPVSGRSMILLESLEALFTAECLLITAYVEAFMPLFYCTYMLTMVHLNNAQYHTEMKVVTRENVGSTMLRFFVFGLLQIISFVLLLVVIKRNCGMRPLYQLGFVLETQRSLIQCKMMLWMVITLCFRVIHYGVDFKFEYARLGFPKFWTPVG